MQFTDNNEQDYQVEWSGFGSTIGSESNLIKNLFDNTFGWVNQVTGPSKYVDLDKQRKKMLEENPDLAIEQLNDGFDLEVERLDAIRQRSSRGFTIIDINPGLLTENDFPLNIPYEFLFDGTNFIPSSSDSIIKNFRSIPIDIAGNFVKVEYIYENNSNANASSGYSRPYANIKYAQSLRNTFSSGGGSFPSEIDLTTGYQNYDFDNFARNKVYVGFGDASQKPHIITRSGDYFKTYFNTLVISLNIGAPKIRITVGFNSEKYDGPTDASINAKLALAGGARLFRDIDTPLMPMNVGLSDTFKPTGIAGVQFNTSNVVTNFEGTLARAFGNINAGYYNSLGYSCLFITSIDLLYILNSVGVAYTICWELIVNNSNNESVRLFKYPIALDPTVTPKVSDTIHVTFPEPIRVVIPYNNNLVCRLSFSSGAATTIRLDMLINGYSLGNIRKIDRGINYDLLTSKFITDSTFLTDYNRTEVVKD